MNFVPAAMSWNRKDMLFMRPCIGITVTQFSDYDGIKLRQDYIRVIEMAGGLPCLLPNCSEDLIPEYLQFLDGLMLTGGDDFAPELFGELPEPVACEFEPKRDVFELALIRGAWEKKTADPCYLPGDARFEYCPWRQYLSGSGLCRI